MTTTMSISEARENLGTLAGLPVTSIEAAKILAALGITVAPEKPEPGRYKVNSTGEYAIVSDKYGQRTLAVMGDDGTARFKYSSDEWPTLTPARVVPAEPVEGPDWDDVRNAVADSRGNGWGLNDEAINAITDAVIALLGGGDRG